MKKIFIAVCVLLSIVGILGCITEETKLGITYGKKILTQVGSAETAEIAEKADKVKEAAISGAAHLEAVEQVVGKPQTEPTVNVMTGELNSGTTPEDIVASAEKPWNIIELTTEKVLGGTAFGSILLWLFGKIKNKNTDVQLAKMKTAGSALVAGGKDVIEQAKEAANSVMALKDKIKGIRADGKVGPEEILAIVNDFTDTYKLSEDTIKKALAAKQDAAKVRDVVIELIQDAKKETAKEEVVDKEDAALVITTS